MFLRKIVFALISYMLFQIKMNAGKMLYTGNFINTKILKNYREHCLHLGLFDKLSIVWNFISDGEEIRNRNCAQN